MARGSVRQLAELQPELVICGQGRATKGQSMRDSLYALALNFDRVAVPKAGVYVDEPAGAADGTAYLTGCISVNGPGSPRAISGGDGPLTIVQPSLPFALVL